MTETPNSKRAGGNRFRVWRSRFKYSTAVLLAAFAFIFTSFCSLRTEPAKVWNLRGKIVTLAKSLIDIPYRLGGKDIDGFDCSGFVYYVYDCFGLKVPRTARGQGKLKNKVKLKHARPGDILVFKLKRGEWHTGILVEKNYFIHAPNRRELVRKEHLDSFWRSRLKAVISLVRESD